MISYWCDDIILNLNEHYIIGSNSKNASLRFELYLNEKNMVSSLYSSLPFLPVLEFELIDAKNIPKNAFPEIKLHQLPYRSNYTVLIHTEVIKGDYPLRIVGIDWNDGNVTEGGSFYQLYNYQKAGTFTISVFVEDGNLDLIHLDLEIQSQEFLFEPVAIDPPPKEISVFIKLITALSIFTGFLSLIILVFFQLRKKGST